MSKFLRNLLLQISKVLVYSKIKFYSEKNFPHLRPNRPSASWPIRTFGPAATLFFAFQKVVPPLPTGPRPLGRPNRPPSSSCCTGAGHTRRRRRPASRHPHGRPRCLHQKKKWLHQSPFIPPLIGAIPPFQSPVTGAFNLGPLKLLQRRPLKALGLPRLTSALLKAAPSSVKTPTPPTLLLLALNAPSPSPFPAEAPPLVRRLSTASRAAATPSLNLPARLSPPLPLGRSSRALERLVAELR
jgi:hypothetical protein